MMNGFRCREWNSSTELQPGSSGSFATRWSISKQYDKLIYSIFTNKVINHKCAYIYWQHISGASTVTIKPNLWGETMCSLPRTSLLLPARPLRSPWPFLDISSYQIQNPKYLFRVTVQLSPNQISRTMYIFNFLLFFVSFFGPRAWPRCHMP